MNTYISWIDWSRAPTGVEWQTLVGNTGRLASVTLGATTLTTIQPITVQLNQYDELMIYDGQSSEIVTVSATANVNATSISVSATQYAHAGGTPYSTPGILGSLADAIVSSSQTLETICHQSLFLSTYTNELLAIPTMRASIDNQYSLHFRPRHWPVNSITALSISPFPGNTVIYDTTYVVIDSDKQICSLPNMQPLPSMASSQTPYPIWNVMSRYQQAQLAITYSGGFSIIPSDVTEAAILLVSDTLTKRLNPMGAADVQTGDRHIATVLRGDLSGESMIYKRALRILNNYTMDTF